MVYMFNIFNRSVVSVAQEITQMNFDVMFWCTEYVVINILVPCIINVHTVCESI